MASPRLATKPPRACAACYGQHLDRAHVDFMAGYEGALIDPARPRAGHVDWLVLCENCIRVAVSLLPEEQAKTEALKSKIEALEERADKAESYADSLEDTLQRRPARDGAPKRARKPRYQETEA